MRFANRSLGLLDCGLRWDIPMENLPKLERVDSVRSALVKKFDNPLPDAILRYTPAQGAIPHDCGGSAAYLYTLKGGHHVPSF